MSGSALSPGSLVGDPLGYAHAVARHANCSTELPGPYLLACLRERPLHALLSVPLDPPDFTWAFGPSVDGVVVDAGEAPPASGQSGPPGPPDPAQYEHFKVGT